MFGWIGAVLNLLKMGGGVIAAPAEITLTADPINRTLSADPIKRTLSVPAIVRTLTCPDPE